TALADSPADALHHLFDQAWERDLADNPLSATYIGDHRFDARLPQMTPAAIAQREAQDKATLEQLKSIDRTSLDAQDQLNYDLFEHEYLARLATQPFKEYLYGVISRDGLQTLAESAELIAFDKVKDYENWIARLRAVGPYLDQNIAL